MDNDSIQDVRRTFYDLQDVLDDIERNKFVGFLSTGLIQDQQGTPSSVKSKVNPSNKQKAMENDNAHPEWRIPCGQKVVDVFSAEEIK